MNGTGQDYKTFEDLEVYKAAREFRKKMYAVARRLPEIEKFGLAPQVRRAAVSLTNNIAEGHGRYHYLDQIKFTLQSRGSLEELIDDLNVCEDENYLEIAEIRTFKDDAWHVHRLINGFIRFLRTRHANADLPLRESSANYGFLDDDQESGEQSLGLFNSSTL
ncbi:MAG: four helix bundle protein [Verrucomicrobiota bacterium]